MAKVPIKCRRNIAKNVNRLSRVHVRALQTDDRQTGDSRPIENVNVSSRSQKLLFTVLTSCVRPLQGVF